MSTVAEKQLWLIAAGTAQRRRQQAEIAAQLGRQVDWERMTEVLRARKLLTVLGPRIAKLAHDSASDGFLAAVEETLDAGRRQGAFLKLISLRATEILADAGIRSTALKGPILSEEIYGDLGRRLSSDIDLLVSAERLEEAAERLRGPLGYAAPSDPLDKDGLPQLHLVLEHERGELPPLELHWRIHWYEREFASDRLLPPADDLTGAWRPAPADDLVALLLYYARDGLIDLRLAADLSAWWDTFGGSLAPGALSATLEEYPALAHAVAVAATAAQRVVGLPATELLSDRFQPRARDRLAVRLANPNPEGASLAQLYADRGLIDALLTPKGDLPAFVRRQLLPPRDVLNQQADHGRRAHARSALERCAGMLGRYGYRLGRLATTRGKVDAGDPTDGGGGGQARIMGPLIGCLREEGVVEEIVGAVSAGRGYWAVTANLDHLRQYHSEPLARELIEEADLVIADGMPLVWASRIAGTPLPERVAGSSLIWSLSEAAARYQVPVVFVGGNPGSAERAAEVLGERYEGLRVVDTICPPFGFEHDEEELERIEQRVASHSPGLVLVGLGFPKQDILIRRLRETMPQASYMGVGVSFSFVAGEIARAPGWTQVAGLEWLYRLSREPRRLADRYLVKGGPFVLRLLGSAVRHRIRPRPGADARWGYRRNGR